MNGLRALGVVVLGATLVACAGHKPRGGTTSTPNPPLSGPRSGRLPPDTARAQSERYKQNNDDGPAAPPIDVSKIAEPVPKAEPRSRYGNKESYSVLGQNYRLLQNPQGYVERGIASWYGNKFHGYMTSSFEPYDMYAFSAAHKTLPLPSYARVTNLDNGKSVIVRVNDRGPFHENRLIDLSYAAAVKIGVWPKGTGLVEVRAIDPDHPGALPPASVADDASSKNYGSDARSGSAGASRATSTARAAPLAVVPAASARNPRDVAAPASPAGNTSAAPHIYLQLGAFGERANAERAVANATRAGLEHVDIKSVEVDGRTVHRVRIGPLADVDAADAMTARIEHLGLGAPRVAIEH